MLRQKAEKFVKDSLSLLDEEREILLSGDLSDLEKVFARKTQISEKLVSLRHELSQSEVGRIRSSTERNARYFRAALDGVQAVQQRLSDIRNAQAGLGTYGSDGTMTTSGAQSGSLERRA